MAYSDPYEQWKQQGRPGGSFQAWQGGQQPAQQAIPLPPQAQTAAPVSMVGAATPFGGTLDQQAQWAHDNINSEFDVGSWRAQGPMDSSCPPNMPYRTARAGGDNACVEHPDNCPEGKTLHGSTCISNEAANQMFGGGYGNLAGQPQGQQAAGSFGQQQMSMGQPNPLQGMLTPMQQAPMAPQAPGSDPLAGFSSQLAGTGTRAPATGATPNLLAQTMAPRQQNAGIGGSLGTGWSGGADGLTQMMQQRQKKLGPQASGQWWG